MSSIVYHSGCADGIVAKEMMRYAEEHLSDLSVTHYIPFQYGMKVLQRELNHKSIWVDCCPESEEEFLTGLQSGCIYIDHHETVKAKFQKWFSEFPDQLIFGETTFGHSGASLTYDFLMKQFHKNGVSSRTFDKIFGDIQKLAALADTWQVNNKDFSKARAMSSLIAIVGNDINLQGCYTSLINMAISYDKNKRQQDEKKAEKIAVTTITKNNRTLNIAILNDFNISDISEILRNREKDPADLIVGFFYLSDKDKFKVVYSLRSNDNFDCSEYAKFNGGGGHIKAAGFSVSVVPLDFDPITYLKANLRNYLETLS